MPQSAAASGVVSIVQKKGIFLAGLASRLYFLTGRYKPYIVMDVQFGDRTQVDVAFGIFFGGGLQIEASRHVGFYFEVKLGGLNFKYINNSEDSDCEGAFDVAIRLGVQFRI